MIQRNEYLGRLAKWREKPAVKLVSGIRGCGKTTLLAMYTDWLKRSGVDDRQIIFISMDNPESDDLLHYQGLYAHIKKQLYRDRFTYVVIDELQRCINFEKAIETLVIRNKVDVYAAASGACSFSTTPYIEIRMLPLSFGEYRIFSRAGAPGRAEELMVFSPAVAAPIPHQQAYPEKDGRRLPRQREQQEKYLLRETFNNYLSFGGFPFTAAMGTDAALIRQCVEGIYNTALIKEAARQTGVNDIPLLEHTAAAMSHSTGSPLSSTKIGAVFSAAGRKIASNTVEMYMRALTSSFIFYHTGRFDIKTGKRLKTLGKYYIADTGIRNLLLEHTAGDLNGQLENIVCMELLRRGFQVCVGKYGGDEVNFAAFRQAAAESGISAYFQVAASTRDTAVLAGKLAPLRQIRDNHPKYILSLDETPFRSNYNGIIQMNLIDWLLETKKQ